MVSDCDRERLIRGFEKLAALNGFEETIQRIPIPAKQSAELRMRDVVQRVQEKTTLNVSLDGMEWEFVASGEAIMNYDGQTFDHFIPPNIFLVGVAVRADGVKVRFFTKFVSHPFHQHGRFKLAA